MRKITTIAFAFSLLLFASCEKETVTPDTPKEIIPEQNDSTSVLQFIQNDANFSTFARVLMIAKMETEIEGNGPYTIFAPDNTAFQKLLDDNNWSTLDDISPSVLTLIAKFHISNSEVKISDLTTGTLMPIIYNNKEVYINLDDPNAPFVILGLTKANITDSDMEFTNGMVHRINGVLSL